MTTTVMPFDSVKLAISGAITGAAPSGAVPDVGPGVGAAIPAGGAAVAKRPRAISATRQATDVRRARAGGVGRIDLIYGILLRSDRAMADTKRRPESAIPAALNTATDRGAPKGG
jgi:hypothetical protein